MQIGPNPIKDWHKIVANRFDPDLREVPNGLLVIFNVPVTRWQPNLNVIVNVDGLDNRKFQPSSFNLSLQGLDLSQRPYFTDRHVKERPDDLLGPRNLPNILELNGVLIRAVPAKSHFHLLVSPFNCGN